MKERNNLKYLIIFLMLVLNFYICYELHDAWSRNERLADINTELYRTGVLKNNHIEKLMIEARDKNDLCNRIIIDKGGIVFKEFNVER